MDKQDFLQLSPAEMLDFVNKKPYTQKPEPVEKIKTPQRKKQEIKEPTKAKEDDRIKEVRKRNSELRKEIARVELECKNLESTFIQASKRCSVKWYAPKWVKQPHQVNKLRQLIYWTS